MLDWSHALLSDRERVLLRRLAVFAGQGLQLFQERERYAGLLRRSHDGVGFVRF
jgi:predicted ATPase